MEMAISANKYRERGGNREIAGENNSSFFFMMKNQHRIDEKEIDKET